MRPVPNLDFLKLNTEHSTKTHSNLQMLMSATLSGIFFSECGKPDKEDKLY